MDCHGNAPPPPVLGGFAALPVGDAAAATATEPAIGTSDVPVVVVSPIAAVRVSEVPAAGVKLTLIVQLPLLGASVIPGQVDDDTRKSAASPPVASVTALFVAKVSGAVPVFLIVTVVLAVAPTTVPGKMAPPLGE